MIRAFGRFQAGVLLKEQYIVFNGGIALKNGRRRVEYRKLNFCIPLFDGIDRRFIRQSFCSNWMTR